MLGWDQTKTPYELLVQHWMDLTNKWNNTGELDRKSLKAVVKILSSEIQTSELNPSGEFFFESHIFPTLAHFLKKSKSTTGVHEIVMRAVVQLIEAFPASYMAHGTVHPVICEILDGLSDQSILVTLLSSIIRKMLSYPTLTGLYIIDGPAYPKPEYQLLNLLSGLYANPQYRTDAKKLLSLLLNLPVTPDVALVTSDSLCTLIVNDLISLYSVLDHTLNPESALLSHILYCNTLTKSDSFGALKEAILDSINKQFWHGHILPLLLHQNPDVTGTHLGYLTEIISRLHSSSPLRSQVVNFFFSV